MESSQWLWAIDTVIILDTGHNVDILARAVERIFPLAKDGNSAEMCVPSWEIAARGAALRALEWRGYYDASQWREWIWDDEYEDWRRFDDWNENEYGQMGEGGDEL